MRNTVRILERTNKSPMGWNTRIIQPEEPPPPRDIKAVSPALLRFFGMMGFVTFGLGTLALGSRWLNLPTDFWTAGSLNGRAIALIAVSFILAFLGMLLGWGLAVAIPVRSERGNHAVSALWHFLANGSLVWFFLVTMVLTKVVGRENAKTFIKQYGEWQFAWAIVGPASAVSIFTGALLLLTRQLRPRERPHLFRCWLIAAPGAFAASHLQFVWLRVETPWWLMIGALFPFLTVGVSAWTIERDRTLRQRLVEERT